MGKKDHQSFFKKNKHMRFILGYGLFYIISFFLLERMETPIHMIHSSLDDKIPFCEYFIVPYVLWFVFVAWTICYFGFRCKNRREYDQLIATLCTSMTIFLIVSFIYPNGHNLRPELTGDNLFVKAVSVLYFLDTPTNILPSLHVFEAIACCTAILKNEKLGKRKGIASGTVVLTVSIVAATMFLKQHSVVDVSLALALNLICYEVFYKLMPRYWEKLAGLFTKKELCTIPNYLSFFRLFLAVLLAGFLFRWDMEEHRGLMIGILLLSALTDFLDGKIARKFHMVSEMGKLLDPLADKVTQGSLLLCFIRKYSIVRSLLLLFLIKEVFMLVMGWKTIFKTKENEGAKWYGKVNTAVFYGVMAILIFGGKTVEPAANVLLLVSGLFMLLAFVLYARQYQKKLEETVPGKKQIWTGKSRMV